MAKRLEVFSQSDEAQKRHYVLAFYKQYGEEATKKAFGVNRKLIYIWRKRLKQANGFLTALLPTSTKPKKVREMTTNLQILEFIKSLRQNHPGIGKEKIKPLLDEYCLKANLPSIAQSTIGKVIKRKNYFFQKSGKIYHDPNSQWAQNKAKKTKRLRVKHPPPRLINGHIQSDTVLRITNGIKDYFYSAIDARMKFSLTLNYPTLNSRNNKDFYLKFKSCYPEKIVDWQSDNGLETLGEFDDQLQRDGIPHLFIYPRCPKINGVIERYNRTLQEEFIDCNLDLIHDTILFNQKLADYLIFYNTKRVHKSLGLKSPMDFLIAEKGMSKKTVTYTGV